MILNTFGTGRISLGTIFLSMTEAGTLVTFSHSNVVITSTGLPPDENSPSRQHFPTCSAVSFYHKILSLTSLKLFSVTIPPIS
jgi:hypothetical protein